MGSSGINAVFTTAFAKAAAGDKKVYDAFVDFKNDCRSNRIKEVKNADGNTKYQRTNIFAEFDRKCRGHCREKTCDTEPTTDARGKIVCPKHPRRKWLACEKGRIIEKFREVNRKDNVGAEIEINWSGGPWVKATITKKVDAGNEVTVGYHGHEYKLPTNEDRTRVTVSAINGIDYGLCGKLKDFNSHTNIMSRKKKKKQTSRCETNARSLNLTTLSIEQLFNGICDETGKIKE